MPLIRRSASKRNTESPISTSETASPAPAPTKRPRVSRSKTAPSTATKTTRKKTWKPSLRKCVGCKMSVNDYLFLGWFATVVNDFKEKCLSCRRFDAINDCLKSHADRDGNLPFKAQLQHINDQQIQMEAWAARMKRHTNANITNQELVQTMVRILEHPALQQANEHFQGQADLDAGLIHSNETSLYQGPIHGLIKSSQRSAPVPSFQQRGPPVVLRLPRQQQAATFTSTTLPPVATSLRSAADALDLASQSLQQRSLHPSHLASVNSMFRRPFDAQTIQDWANLVAQGANLSVEQDRFFRTLDEKELEAVGALMRMNCDNDWEQEA